MIKQHPWDIKGIWLKGNIHTHTTNSDGLCTPEEIAREYKRHGYDFVFLTDHDKRTVPAKTFVKPLLIPAEELGLGYKNLDYHFVCLGLKEEWQSESFRSPEHLLNHARRKGVFVVQGHPYWCGNPSNLCVYRGGLTCPGVEIYNNTCDRGTGKGYSLVHWDDLLAAGHRILGFAVDDAHHPSVIAGGWIMAKAKAKTPDAILTAIRKGYFYSSQGPEIKSISIRGREMKVSCSPVKRINFISNQYGGRCIFGTAARALTEAKWIVRKGKRYVRIEIVDASGKSAWSNPFFFSR